MKALRFFFIVFRGFWSQVRVFVPRKHVQRGNCLTFIFSLNIIIDRRHCNQVIIGVDKVINVIAWNSIEDIFAIPEANI